MLGDRIVLIGNLEQVGFLKRATPREVAERTRRMVRVGKPGGRYIAAAADFIERGTPLGNLRAMIEAAKDEGDHGSRWCACRESNAEPSAPEADALSN